MQSCTCQPRQTLADRINAIIAKYDTCPCPIPTERPTRSVPKILSSPCLRRSPCLPCPTIPKSSCCPQQSTIAIQLCPGPGLQRYISRRELCPALRGCLSLYKRPSAVCCPADTQQSCCKSTCSTAPRCNPSIGCCKSRQSCAVVTLNSQPAISTKSQKNCNPCVPYCKSREVTCPQCSPCSRSISNNCNTRQRICRPCSPPRCSPCNPCSTKLRSTTPCCYSCGQSSELSSSSSSTPGNCFTPAASSCSGRRRLTVFDDPPYTSNFLEREFSSRFIRLDPCYCETDSSSSLENSNFGNKYR